MSVTVTNLPDHTMAMTEAIDAQTAFMESQSATYGEYLNTIANTPLSCSTASTPADLAPKEVPCCRKETLEDTPEAGDTTVRETCSDGKVTDVVTYAEENGGGTCTFNVRDADPSGSFVTYDENCNEILTDVENACKPRRPGQPYPRYFSPKASDFGNQIFCDPDSTYAFAWTGVNATNIEKFFKDTPDINLDDPSNKYVAVVDRAPYSCTPSGIQSGPEDLNGDATYCFAASTGITYAHTTGVINDVVDSPMGVDSTVAFNADGTPILNCPGLTEFDTLDPLQQSQLKKIGFYADIGFICEAWDGKVESSADPDSDTGIVDSIKELVDLDIECPDIEGLTSQGAYYKLWHDYWCCEKRTKAIQQRIYAGQIPIAIAGLLTSINTYNKILDKELDVLCDVTEDIDLVAQCSASLLGTDEEPGIIKECQSNLLEGHNDRIGTINDRGKAVCEWAEDEFDCYQRLWDPIRKKEAPIVANRLENMINNGSVTSTDTLNWAEGMEGCIKDNILPELKRQFAPLLGSVNCTSNNLNDWRQELKDKAAGLSEHYTRVFQSGEATMIPQMMEMSTCMVQRICEMRDWLYDCAKCDMDIYQKGYQMGEIGQAQAAMTTAAQLIPKLTESVNWLDQNIPYALDIFQACYADEQRTLNPQLWDNARELAPEIVECYKYFKDKSFDSDQFFENCYKDRECRLVKQQLDFARELTQFVDDSLRRLDKWSEEDRDMFDENFRSREITNLQTVSHNGELASNELHDFSHWMDERTKQFHETYNQFWLPCDIENLKQHCEVWTRGNPLQGMERNNEQLNRLGKDLHDVVNSGLVHAHTFMDQVFEEADRFDYCVETPAYLHVRKQIDRAQEELERCTPRWATGHLLDAQLKLKAEGARAEGAAFEAATRWKWWANEQLDDKAHRRRVEALGLIDAFALRTIDANKTETAGYDLLLNHMREAIGRGRIYMENMQQAAQATATMQSSQIDSLMRAVQLWHFWPELALQEANSFQQAANQVQKDAYSILELGRYWPQAADQQKQSALNVVDSSLDTAMELSRLGQFYLSQADQMNTQRANLANTAGALGNQFAQTGHNLHRIASDKAGNALQTSISAGQVGLGASEIGASHMNTALEIENRMTLNALEHLKAGIGAFGIGIDFLQEVRQAYQLSGSYGLDASNSMINLFKHGQNDGFFAASLNEQCIKTQYEMLCKAKDFAQRNFQITQASLHGGTAGTLNAATDILNGQGNNASSAFALLGNSLQGLSQNTATPPFPTGGAAFGTGGGGTFGTGGGGGFGF